MKLSNITPIKRNKKDKLINNAEQTDRIDYSGIFKRYNVVSVRSI